MNNLKNEQSKSNTNEPTLSNTYLFGQNSVNANKTLINNIIKDNLIVINENNNMNNNKNTISIDKNEKNYENNLILEIMTSWNLPEGYNLTIRNKYGLENSLIKRNLKEKEDRNIVYFGFQREEDLNTSPNIDYLLYPKEDFYDSKFIGKHFQIRYDEDDKLYYIKDLGFGFGTFIKLTKVIKLKDNFLINIGETYIVFSLKNNNTENDENQIEEENENDNENEKNSINIKVFSGDEKCDNYNFDYLSNRTILIGRSAICNLVIEDKMLSRVHCSVFFIESENKEDRGWYLKDGNLNGKKSTNDTWFYSAEETLIEDNMIFKTNHNLFKCIIQKEKK
jgi:pSer/pThr/pTyr-binding forkhead associated (FHA) protein